MIEARQIRPRPARSVHPPVPRPPDDVACTVAGCGGPATAQCGQCSAAFCPRHGLTLSDLTPSDAGPGRCRACIDATLQGVFASAARSGGLDEAIEALTPWATDDGSGSAARRLLGLLHAQRQDLDRALALLEPLARAEEGPTLAQRHPARVIAELRLRRAGQAAERADFVAAALDAAEAARLDPDLEAARRALPLLNEWQALGLVQAAQLDEAAEIWEAELGRRPTDLRLIHQLAILNYRRASELEVAVAQAVENAAFDASGEARAALWRKAIMYWAVVLRSPAFWSGFAADRQERSGLDLDAESLDQIAAVTADRLLRDLRAYASAHEMGQRTELARRYRELEVTCELELAVASLVQDCAAEARLEGWPAGIGVGPLMLEHLVIGLAGRQLVTTLRRAIPTFQGADGQRLARYLTPLGRHHLLVDRGRNELAVAWLEELAAWPQAQGLLAEALSGRGQELFEHESWEEALASFERAASVGAVLDDRRDVIATIAVKRTTQILELDDEAYEQAVAVLERGQALAGDHQEIRSNLAATYAQRARQLNNAGDYDGALTLLLRAVDLDPGNRQARNFGRISAANLAFEVIGQDLDRAISLFEVALQFEQDNDMSAILSNLLSQRARELALAHDRGRAVALMQKRIAYQTDTTDQPTVDAARARLQSFLLSEAADRARNNDLAGAISMAQEALAYVDDSEGRSILATLQLQAQRIDDAVRTLRDGLTRDPHNAELRRHLAITLHNHGVEQANANRNPQAIHSLREALAVLDTPNTREQLATLMTNEGIAHANAGRHDQAIDLLRQAQGIRDTTSLRQVIAVAYANRATARAQAGNTYAARQDLHEAIKYNPSDQNFRTLLNRL
jgi:tetratricopeptide (TPR) repeat protein